MSGFEENFSGFDEWRKQIYALQPFLDEQIEQIYSDAADFMVQTAQSLCPVEADAPFRREPGTLRNSIRKDIGSDGERTVTRVIEGSDVAYYATFVEFGTRAGTKGTAYVTDQGRRRRVYRDHPGTVPRPHYFPAYHLAQKMIYERLAQVDWPDEPESKASLVWHAVTFPINIVRYAAEL